MKKALTAALLAAITISSTPMHGMSQAKQWAMRSFNTNVAKVQRCLQSSCTTQEKKEAAIAAGKLTGSALALLATVGGAAALGRRYMSGRTQTVAPSSDMPKFMPGDTVYFNTAQDARAHNFDGETFIALLVEDSTKDGKLILKGFTNEMKPFRAENVSPNAVRKSTKKYDEPMF